MRLTFEIISACEPKLLDLEKQCKKIKRTTPSWFDRNRIWYKQLKPQFYWMVGHGRKESNNINCILYTSEAYDVGYRHLVDILEI